MNMNWVAIFKTPELYQAELIKAILCDNGVEAVVLNQKDSSYTTFGEISVMVSEEDSERAEKIIKSL